MHLHGTNPSPSQPSCKGVAVNEKNRDSYWRAKVAKQVFYLPPPCATDFVDLTEGLPAG